MQGAKERDEKTWRRSPMMRRTNSNYCETLSKPGEAWAAGSQFHGAARSRFWCRGGPARHPPTLHLQRKQGLAGTVRERLVAHRQAARFHTPLPISEGVPQLADLAGARSKAARGHAQTKLADREHRLRCTA